MDLLGPVMLAATRSHTTSDEVAPPAGATSHWKSGVGITTTGAGVSLWEDQIGSNDLAQATDANRPVDQGDGSILFDGVDNFLKSAAFTNDQPTTIGIAFKQITWTSNEAIFDGDTASTGVLRQTQGGVSPQLQIRAGANLAESTAGDLPLDTYGVVIVVFNGASSVLRVNGTETAGDAGVSNMGGLTLGANGALAGHSHIRALEVILYAGTALNEAQRVELEAYLESLIP